MRKIVGIDPGLEGGIVVLNEEGGVEEKWRIPTIVSYTSGKKKKATKKAEEDSKKKATKSKKTTLDLVSLNQIFTQLKGNVDHAVLEQVASRPGMSAPAVFKFGRVYGILEGLLVAHQIPYTLCIPRVWCKVIHKGIEGGMEPKDKSRVALGRLFPSVDLRSSERATKPHDGLMDALLIAEWGRREIFLLDR